ncbi:MAG TPA: hypothetical protein VFF19_17385 [Reyranella sp.]|nr:hypothetical protein [Reyranella sp.]
MAKADAVTALAALAQDNRRDVFRLSLRTASDGGSLIHAARQALRQ